MSLVVSALSSPVAVSAPAPGAVARRAASFGAAWVCVRPSSRSFSGWVAACLFSCPVAARRFAVYAAGRLSVPFCVCRPVGSWFAVSVPVSVASVPAVPVGSLPVSWFALGSSAPALAPSALEVVLSAASVVGFSGSRSPSRLSSVALSAALVLVPLSVRVCVGCARGVDAAVRGFFVGASVFSVASGRWGAGRGAFAARSVACVRAVAAAGSGGLWLSFPSGACPVGLSPSSASSRCFSGFGSGSWASLAFAVGLGVPSLLFLPGGLCPPSGWGFAPLSGCPGWFFFPGSSQLSLL
jgi:hypothetical protein